MPNKFDRADFDRRKAAKDELDLPHEKVQGVPGLEVRVQLLEEKQGIYPIETTNGNGGS